MLIWLIQLTPAFVSGTVLYRWIEHTASVEIQPPSRGVWRPSSPLRRLHSSDVGAARGLWHVAALATIVLEIAIPCGLLFSSTWLAVAFVGVGMHIVFTALYPVKLVPFSLSTVGSYALFLPLMSGPWLHLG